jgi:hypothetical protein
VVVDIVEIMSWCCISASSLRQNVAEGPTGKLRLRIRVGGQAQYDDGAVDQNVPELKTGSSNRKQPNITGRSAEGLFYFLGCDTYDISNAGSTVTHDRKKRLIKNYFGGKRRREIARPGRIQIGTGLGLGGTQTLRLQPLKAFPPTELGEADTRREDVTREGHSAPKPLCTAQTRAPLSLPPEPNHSQSRGHDT